MRTIDLHLFDFRETNPIEALRILKDKEDWAKWTLLSLERGAELNEGYSCAIHLHFMMHHDDHGTESKQCYFFPDSSYGNIVIDGIKYILDFHDETSIDLQHIDWYYEKITYCFMAEIEDKNLSYPS